MGITHAFVSEVADSPDASLVRPSNWNDDHVTPLTTKGDLLSYTGTDLDRVPGGVEGSHLVTRSGETTGLDWETQDIAITWVIDGGGAAITTGSKGFLKIPFGCTLTEWELEADIT